ncbi:MAG: CehA/McbA family metallohydrolase [Chloroflexi bacterium]|nr:CehA/McbA family metallohydrolase [Chloroflexota bacterium]
MLWLKGNIHTHTSLSDGDALPAEAIAWYADNGFDFLSITDHNMLTVAESDRLVLIPGTEITLMDEGKPVHVNALGIHTMPALPGWQHDIARTLQAAVHAARAAGGLPMINHPNFHWAFGEAEMARVTGWTLLEIMNTSTDCNSFGGGGQPSVEAMWDGLLSRGVRVWAAATDDMHDLRKPWYGHVSPPGRGWICVRAADRTAAAILAAIELGDFYASTEVELADLTMDARGIRLAIRPAYDYAYTTQFIGRGERVLAVVHGTTPAYAASGDEGYVRARVFSSNGGWAWTQPLWVDGR